MKPLKYEYTKVIQQNYGNCGWEDVSEYPATSQGVAIDKVLIPKLPGHVGDPGRYAATREIYVSCLSVDLKEYRLLGYPTRVIFRKTKKSN